MAQGGTAPAAQDAPVCFRLLPACPATCLPQLSPPAGPTSIDHHTVHHKAQQRKPQHGGAAQRAARGTHPGWRPCLKLRSAKPREMEPPLASLTVTSK